MSLQEYIANKIMNGVDVNVQDQHTEPLDSLFAQSVSNFTLSADTVASGIEPSSLVYTFEATAGHLIVAGNEILLLDTISERSFFAEVISVSTNIIALDRPIDHVYSTSDTLGRRVTTNMAVNGSSTPQIFSLRAGSNPIDVVRTILTIKDSTAMDDGKFGGITALTRGLVFRIVNSYQKTIFTFKTNGEIKQMSFDGNYQTGVSGPSGTESFTSRITFGGQAKHGVVLRIATGDALQWVVQDDLTDLDNVTISAQGHYTTGEE